MASTKGTQTLSSPLETPESDSGQVGRQCRAPLLVDYTAGVADKMTTSSLSAWSDVLADFAELEAGQPKFTFLDNYRLGPGCCSLQRLQRLQRVTLLLCLRIHGSQ